MPGRGAACLILFAALAPAVALLAPGVVADDPELLREVENEELRRRTLERRIELAKGDAFYLLLDPARGTLRLMLQEAELQRFDLRGIEIGTPRITWVARDLPDEWRGRVWVGGTLEPPRENDRIEIVPPDPDASGKETPFIPPLPEEAYPVPHRYLVRFEEGLALEVRPEGEGDTGERAGLLSRLAAGIGAWWSDAVSAARPVPSDRIRIRLHLAAEDGDSLYRALPPDVSLLVLPEAAAGQ